MESVVRASIGNLWLLKTHSAQEVLSFNQGVILVKSKTMFPKSTQERIVFGLVLAGFGCPELAKPFLLPLRMILVPYAARFITFFGLSRVMGQNLVSIALIPFSFLLPTFFCSSSVHTALGCNICAIYRFAPNFASSSPLI